MVRRRGNKATNPGTSKGAGGTNGILLQNTELKSTVGCANLEDQYFASPKRKDCKVETSISDLMSKNEMIAVTNLKTKSLSTNKTRGGITGRTIGVPLATRSQTRTIENFFQAKPTAKPVDNVKPVDNNATKCFTTDTAISNEASNCSENFTQYTYKNVQPPPSDSLIEQEEEDTTDTEYSEKLSDEIGFAVDFITHRSQLRDSHSSSGSACINTSNTENIFLQEPVLTLNVDKTPNQASSYIKINTSLDAGPIFSSQPTLTSTLNGRFNQIVTLNIQASPEKRNSNDNDNDNSSCDSGVAFTTSSQNNDLLLKEQKDKIADFATEEQICQKKPATPHRILCPSPIKTLPQHIISPQAAITVGRISSPSGRKLNKEQLSPRKSPRKVTTNIQTKTRRRLNQQKDFFNRSNVGMDSAAETSTNECTEALINNIGAADTLPDEDFDCENLEEVITTQQQHKCTSFIDHLIQPQQKLNVVKSHVVKLQPHKSKYQNGQPLVATNNNRDIKGFFPVRRSVRKTKTAVKEEMMRTLEKAILDEQADGLKIAYFDGKGRGIVADRHFQRGEFVVEYIGDLISMAEAGEREKRYALDENAGCYMYYFKHKNQQYCIDATVDTGKLGRLVNHSRNGNLVTKVVVVKQRPHLILLAKDDIEPGEELTYDYGDRSKESLLHHPWLAF